ncbi:MAG: hypothetical protein ABSF03_25760 [Streptosporangiaceae bacterium]
MDNQIAADGRGAPLTQVLWCVLVVKDIRAMGMIRAMGVGHDRISVMGRARLVI